MNKSGWPSSTVKHSPTVPSKDEKKPQRRTPWACDECRLRKRKCDGVEPCSPCQRSGLECSYHFRRPAPPQTQRIQMLEVHLRYVRSFLHDACRKVPPELRADFESVLQKISSVAPEAPSPPNGTESSHHMSVDDGPVSAYLGDPPVRPSSTHHGVSQQTFLQQVLNLTSGGSEDDHSKAISALFELPLPTKHELSPAQLPSQHKATLLIDALFDSQLPILSFLHERYFRDMVDLVYSTKTPDDGIKTFRPLLHFALALGRLFIQTDHGAQGCEEAKDEAMQHYLAGQELLDPLAISNLTSLQTVLCAVVFLIATCRMTNAHALIGLACSLALRLGLHAKNTSLPAEEQLFRARACAAVLYVDSIASLILGAPPFIQQAEVDLGIFDQLAAEAYRRKDWQTVTIVAQLKLLFVCRSNEDTAFSGDAVEDTGMQHSAIKQAGTKLKGWRDHVGSLLQELENQAGDSGFHHELEMLYNFSFLLLWRPLLLDLLTRGTSNGKSQISPDDFQFAQACINLAETCRSRTEEASQEHRANVFSWSPIYTSFLSELYVLALLSVESLRPQLECTNDLSALGGYRRLAASRCGDSCATPAMDLLKIVARHLPVNGPQVDVQGIEVSTRRYCDTSRQDNSNSAQPRNDDILNLLNTRSHEAATSTSSASRSPSLL